MKISLTRDEAEALCAILNEREAGGTSDLADALGIDDEDDAERMMDRLGAVSRKLYRALHINPEARTDG